MFYVIIHLQKNKKGMKMEVFIGFAIVILFIGFVIKTVSKSNFKSDVNIKNSQNDYAEYNPINPAFSDDFTSK